MARSCLLYYITDRKALAEDEPTRRRRLLEKIEEATRAGVDYIQLREKDLTTRDLEALARDTAAILTNLRTENQQLKTALLINSRTDVALATGSDGVHLRGDDVSPPEVRFIFKAAHVGTDSEERTHVGTAAPGCPPAQSAAEPAVKAQSPPRIAVSCHSQEEVTQAAAAGATFAVFAPIFEKRDAPSAKPVGLDQLRRACRGKIPVLALGGITLQNAESCLEAGASGIAAIRLFQENNIAEISRKLRS
jgi:thiamine-phosphate pyrophosphorylase